MFDSYTISPLGDAAITIDFGNLIDLNLNKEALELAQSILASKIFGVKDIVPAYSSVTVYYDVVTVKKKFPHASAYRTIESALKNLLLQERSETTENTRMMKVPVCYAEKFALDHADVCTITGLSFDEIVRIHTSAIYRVYMVGFLPGFAYMGEVHESIAVPRKKEPRVKVEAGYVGIAGKQTGIYPLTSPGGWQIIGRTPLKLFDKNKEEPVLFKAGDRAEFFPITEDEFENY